MAIGQAAPGTSVPIGVQVSPGGPGGLPGVGAASVLTGSFTVPPIGSTVLVTLQDASWVTPGQTLYVAGAGGGTTAGDFYVQSKSGNQLTLLNSPASGGAKAYTTSSAPFTVPPSGGTVTTTVGDASWMTVGETVWVAGA